MNMHLTKYDVACQALMEAASVDEVKTILDKAVAMAVYARLANDTTLFADARVVKVRAERRLGEMLIEQKEMVGLAKGTRGQGRPKLGGTVAEPPKDTTPTLADANISKKQSSRSQKLAKLPEVSFEQLVVEERTKAIAQAEKAQAGAGKKATKKKKKAAHGASVQDGCTVKSLDELIAAGRKFGTIYADPPWLYDNQATRGSADNHYEGLTVEQLCDLPIEKLAADDAHLHLWTTNAFLFQCPRIFEAWGFEFKSSFVWVKPQIGMGNYWRNSHEFLLTAVRGDAKNFKDKNLKSWLECKRGKHSAKPERVRHLIERAHDDPRRLEIFGRSSSPGWVVWGDQITRTIFDKSLENAA